MLKKWRYWKFNTRNTYETIISFVIMPMNYSFLNTLIPSNFASNIFSRLWFFAQLNNSYIRAWITFAHWRNLYFRVGLSYDWKCSERHCVKYVENTRKYEYDSLHIRENTDQRNPVFRHISRSERTVLRC